MNPGILSRANFLDIVIVIILLRTCYIAAKTGLPVEIFKFFGVIFVTYISLHYYTNLADIIARSILPKGLPLEFFDFLIFFILVSAGYLGFAVIRSIFYRYIKLEAVPLLSKFGGFILGLLRGFFVTGLLVFMLSISSVSYFSGSVKHSYLGSRAFLISPNTYAWLLNNIFSKFSSKVKFNPTVNEVIDRFNRQ